ncbi:hypothetical protein D3C71_338700 [compost metagenome]
MKLTRIPIVLAALLAAGSAMADGLVQLPFARAEADAPESAKIWAGFGDDYIASKDPNLRVFTARVKTPEGDDLVVSQLNSPFVCGDIECPVRIVRNDIVVYDNSVCRYTEKWALNPSMRTLFACDAAVPTIEPPKE